MIKKRRAIEVKTVFKSFLSVITVLLIFQLKEKSKERNVYRLQNEII